MAVPPAKDKILHFVVSAMGTSVLWLLIGDAFLSGVSMLAGGMIWEIYELATGKNDEKESLKDVLADFLGVGLAVVVLGTWR